MKKLHVKLLLLVCIVCTSCAKKESKESMKQENIRSTMEEQDEEEYITFNNLSKVLEQDDSPRVSLQNGRMDPSLVESEESTEKANECSIGNLGMSVGDDSLQLFTTDFKYDISYYVNLGGDYFIYRLKDGKAELVLEIPAKHLYCRDGKLYFIVNSYGLYTFAEELKEGNILCLNQLQGK